MAVDYTGHIYVGIELRNLADAGSVMFDEFQVTPGEYADILIIKLTSNGKITWIKHITGPGYQYLDVLRGCGDGIVIAGGAPPGTLDLGGGVLPDATFLAKFDGDGAHVWSRSLPTPGVSSSLTILDLACDACEGVAVSGNYEGQVDLGDGTMIPTSGADGFVARYDAEGHLKWGRGLGSVSGEQAYGYSVAVATSGTVAVAGWYTGSLELGDGLTAVDETDGLVATFNEAGGLLWARTIGTHGRQYATAVAINAAGDVAVGGQFLDEITLGANTYHNVSPGADSDTRYDAFLAVLDTNGGITSSSHLGTKRQDEIFSLQYESGGRIFVSGTFSDAYMLRAFANGAPGWTWSSEQLVPYRVHATSTDGATIVTTTVESEVDLGAGPLGPSGSGDLVLTKVLW